MSHNSPVSGHHDAHHKLHQSLAQIEEIQVKHMKSELAADLKEQPELNTTYHITRFLRARNHNFEKAKLMLKNYLATRKKRNIYKLAQTTATDSRVPIWHKVYAAHNYGLDNEGRQIILEFLGKYDFKTIHKTFSVDDIYDYFMTLQDRMLFVLFPKLSEIAGRRVDRLTVIADLKDMGIMDFTKGRNRFFLEALAKIFQDYYPELLGKSVVINAPFGVAAIWTVAKQFLDKKTSDKFEIFSDNGLNFFTKMMSLEQLPVSLGGRNVAPVELGFSPANEAMEDAIKRGSLFLADRTPEYQYFYSEEERTALNSTLQTNDTNTERPTDNHTPESQKPITNNSALSNSDMLVSNDALSIREVRVTKYFSITK